MNNQDKNIPATSIDLSPEKKLLRERYESLKIEFAELFEQKTHMLSYEEGLLTALYLELIGQKQYELFCLQTEVRSLRMKQQLIQAALNRNEKPDVPSIEKKIKKELSDYYKQIEQQTEELNKAKELLRSPMLSIEETNEVKTLYRILVKHLHPDLHPDLASQKVELFHQVQAAYKLCDLHKLREYALLIDSSLESMEKESEDALKEQVEAIERQVIQLQEQIDALNNEFPFLYRMQLANDGWIATQQQCIMDEINVYEKEKLRLLDIIDLQVG